MKKNILTMALAFAASVCFACTTSNDNSNQVSSDESVYVSVNETFDDGWAGTYTFKGTDGKTYKFVLKKDKKYSGKAVLYVNGKETDYGSWKHWIESCVCSVSFDDTVVAIPGQPKVGTFYLKFDDDDVLYAYACGAQQSENPKKRVKCTQIK